VMASKARITLGMLVVCTLAANGSSVIAAEEIKRQRPGVQPDEVQAPLQFYNPGALRRPGGELPRESIPIPDRWRLINTLGILQEDIYDPYNQNIYKGDMPLHDDWFLSLSAISDTILEPRRISPTGSGTSRRAMACHPCRYSGCRGRKYLPAGCRAC